MPETNYHIRITTNSSRDSVLEEYCTSHPNGTIYHHPGWFTALEKENGCPVFRMICFDDKNAVRGYIPLLITKGLPFKLGSVAGSKRLSSLPRTPHCGVIADNKDIATMLLKSAMEMAKTKRIPLFQCKSMNSTLALDIPDLQQVVWRKTFIKEFPPIGKSLNFGEPRNRRRIENAVRKAGTLGVSTRVVTDRNELKKWYKLYVKTMQRHCIPARSLRFFLGLWDVFSGNGCIKLIAAYKQMKSKKKMIAGSIFLILNKNATYAYNGADERFFFTRANDAIQWDFQHLAHNSGIRTLDLGEVSEGNSGLLAFKRKWDVVDKKMYHYYSPKVDIHPFSEDRNLMFSYIASLWKFVPTQVAAPIGAVVNKYL